MFVLGQLLYGVIYEVRIWYELLPLGWMVVSEAVTRQRAAFNDPDAKSAAMDRTGRLLRGSHWLVMSALFVIVLGLFALTRFNASPAKSNTTAGGPSTQALTAAAQAGDAGAQFRLAIDCENKQDYDAAMPWLQRAAEQGLAEAQYNLGMVLSNVRHDSAGAEKWFKLAADQGHPAAQYSLGVIYWDKQNYHEAVPLFRESAQKGDAYSQWMLGRIYLNPTEGRDLVQAYKWLKLARLQELAPARKDFDACAAQMTAEQIVAAEQQVKEFQVTK